MEHSVCNINRNASRSQYQTQIERENVKFHLKNSLFFSFSYWNICLLNFMTITLDIDFHAYSHGNGYRFRHLRPCQYPLACDSCIGNSMSKNIILIDIVNITFPHSFASFCILFSAYMSECVILSIPSNNVWIADNWIRKEIHSVRTIENTIRHKPFIQREYTTKRRWMKAM